MSDASWPGFIVRKATREESAAIAEIIRVAFQSVADAIGMDIPPLHESPADVLATHDAGDIVLVAEADGRLVGTVRGETLEDDSVIMVRRLAVLPEARGAGIARKLMGALEAAYPEAGSFELFTGDGAVGAVRLYESLGYHLTEPRYVMDFPLIYMEKCR
jgi:GNAT superfamily N-acetyltransferase